jgi:hypothetical protein
MSRIILSNLTATATLNRQEMSRTPGGWLWLVGPLGQTLIATLSAAAAMARPAWHRFRVRRAARNTPAAGRKVTGIIRDH